MTNYGLFAVHAAYYALSDFQNARLASESPQAENDFNGLGSAVVYDRLGRHVDAETIFSQFRAARGDAAAVIYAMTYAH